MCVPMCSVRARACVFVCVKGEGAGGAGGAQQISQTFCVRVLTFSIELSDAE